MGMKMLNKTLSKKGSTIIDEFDDSARDWGWTQDQGTGQYVNTSEQRYNESKAALIKYILSLETKVKSLKLKEKSCDNHKST